VFLICSCCFHSLGSRLRDNGLNVALFQKCHVTLELAPQLCDDDIRKEAVNVLLEQRETKEKEKEERKKREAAELAAKQLEEEKAVGVNLVAIVSSC